VVLSVQSGAFAADSVTAGSAGMAELELGALHSDREHLGVEEAGGDAVDLSAAEVIVAVGRGIGKSESMSMIEDLATALGAEIGASRPVIDRGWLSRNRQIGSSGQIVAPKLYLGVGISGAIQHLVGMKGANCVVAINKDPGAPIFSVSHYGIVGDLHQVLPPLIVAIEEAQNRR
jgi:electron transfer flavoprotein alpha subunit